MKQFEKKVLFIKDEEMMKDVVKIAKGKTVLNYLWLGYKFMYYNFKGKQFSMKLKDSTDQEITLEQFKELLKQK